MENQALTELGHAPKICKLFVDDPFIDRVQEINDLPMSHHKLREFQKKSGARDII
jgi:hypothetical protein